MTFKNAKLSVALFGLFFADSAAARGVGVDQLRGALHPSSRTPCAVNLSNGVEIDFAQMSFREDGFHKIAELVVVGFPTNAAFDPSKIKAVRYWDEIYPAKLTKSSLGMSYFAFNASFLEVFWGSSDQFYLNSDFGDASSREVHFELPSERGKARKAISEALTCWENLSAE